MTTRLEAASAAAAGAIAKGATFTKAIAAALAAADEHDNNERAE